MKMGNSAFELANLRAEQERDAGVQRASETLRRQGEINCIDCAEPIPAERRAALPSADRCVDCQMTRDQRIRRPA